jgi:hypothetical protein
MKLVATLVEDASRTPSDPPRDWNEKNKRNGSNKEGVLYAA